MINLLIVNVNPCYSRTVMMGNHTNAEYVRNASGPSQASGNMRSVILEKNLTNVTSVGKPSVVTHTLEIIRKFLKRGLMNVSSVVVPSVLRHVLPTIIEPITERKLTNALNAANPFTPPKVLKDIRAFMLQKKVMNVKNVESAFMDFISLRTITEPMSERDLTFVMIVANALSSCNI
ncbi:Zinc finger protein 844 [Lemmus lemmus]